MMDDPPFPEGQASYTPVCLKDNQFEIALGNPTGRCGLLPKMKIGSQCIVPGNGMTPKLKANSSEPENVCGAMAKIFPVGFGRGGIRGAGVGQTSAQWTNPGGTFMGGTGSDQILEVIDMKAIGFGDKMFDPKLTAGFSLYMKVQLEGINKANLFSIGD